MSERTAYVQALCAGCGAMLFGLSRQRIADKYALCSECADKDVESVRELLAFLREPETQEVLRMAEAALSHAERVPASAAARMGILRAHVARVAALAGPAKGSP